MRRLKAGSTPFDSARACPASHVERARRGTARPGASRLARQVRAASALGLGRPVILLSPAVLALDDDSLDAIVMHEHAHLARFDDWTQLAQAVVSALLALHPAAWFIGRRIRLEREAACDDFVRRSRCSGPRVCAIAHRARRSRTGFSRGSRSPSRARRARARNCGSGCTACSTRRGRVTPGSPGRRLQPARPRWRWRSGSAAQAPALVVFVESHVPAPPVAALARAGDVRRALGVVRRRGAGREPAGPTGVADATAPARRSLRLSRRRRHRSLPLRRCHRSAPLAMPLVPVPASQRVVPGDLDIATHAGHSRFTPRERFPTSPPRPSRTRG